MLCFHFCFYIQSNFFVIFYHLWILGLTLIDINFFYYREQIISLYLFLSLSDSNCRSKINLTWRMDTCFRDLSQKERNRIMKSIIAVIFLCTFSVTAAATMQERDNGPLDRLDGHTYYSTLERHFHNSSAAERSGVIGWMSGRCYSLEDQNSPKATLLAGSQAGPKPSHHQFFLFLHSTKDPKYFDTFYPTDKDGVSEAESVISSLARFSRLEDGSLVYKNSFAFLTDTKYSLRKNVMPGSGMPYLLSKTTLTAYPSQGVINHTFTHYCYYFKKVKE